MTTQTASLDIRSEDSLIISFSDLRIFCEYSKSQNGQYILAFYDGDPFKHVGGHRKEGKGVHFLICDNQLLVMGQVERPNDGKVANNGFFIINDWLFDDNTSSIAYGFNQKGEIIIKKRLKANLLTNAISSSGHYAVFKTCDSNTTDHDSLFLYDLTNGALVWKKKFGFQNPFRISINDEENIILHYKDRQGILLDWEAKHVGYINT
jgi:hypothetical protein